MYSHNLSHIIFSYVTLDFVAQLHHDSVRDWGHVTDELRMRRFVIYSTSCVIRGVSFSTVALLVPRQW